MIEAITAHVAAANGVDVEDVTYTLHSGSRGSLGFVTFLLSADGTSLPVCRVAREDEALLRDEYDRLQLANDVVEAGGWVNRTIEHPTSLERLDGRLALFTERLNGTPADRLITDDDAARRVLFAATDWLVAFVRSTSEHHVRDRTEKRAVVDRLLSGEHSSHAERFVRDDRLFAGPIHGDFIPGNILFADGELSGVVDFENFLIAGVPLFDLCRLIVGTAMLREEQGTLVRRTFFEETAISRAVWDCVRRYAAETSVPLQALLDVLPMYPELMLSHIASANEHRTPPSDLVSIHRHLRRRLERDDPFSWAQ